MLLDSGCLTNSDYFLPFALTDVLTTFSGMQHQPIIHFWQLDQAMILGMKDTRVPHLKEGIASLQENDYSVVVRNAGGLGVIADSGILNVSLILPNNSEHKLSIDAAYELMWAWLRQSFPEKEIDAFEITTSYCPGTYDLSIGGQKFAGIAQRRVKDGISVMIYISVNGNQLARGEVVRDFYLAGLQEQFGENGYPPVDPAVMANLETLIETPLTIDAVKTRLIEALPQQFEKSIDPNLTEPIITSEWFQTNLTVQLEKMAQRNALTKGEIL
ncbi:TPA: lipoate--protein ligase family protein [Enterococcus faecalis]|nr:lipoate--protein ligase family protein [Enterococcus faecalis]